MQVPEPSRPAWPPIGLDDIIAEVQEELAQVDGFIEEKIEDWMGLEINREKTRVVDLRCEGESLDFLGYTYRYDRDQKGREHRYLHLGPSKKAMAGTCQQQ